MVRVKSSPKSSSHQSFWRLREGSRDGGAGLSVAASAAAAGGGVAGGGGGGGGVAGPASAAARLGGGGGGFFGGGAAAGVSLSTSEIRSRSISSIGSASSTGDGAVIAGCVTGSSSS